MRRIVLIAVLGGSLAAPVSSALAAADGSWSCRASVLRIAGSATSTVVEPLVANRPDHPCNRDTRFQQVVDGSNEAGEGRLELGSVSTDGHLSTPPADGDHVEAKATGADIRLVAGTYSFRATTVSARVKGRCENGAVVGEDESRVTGLVVNGEAVQLPSDDASMDIELANGVLHVNARIHANGAIIRRALWFEGLSGDLVAGEARAGIRGRPCQEAAPPPPPSGPPMPAWSCRASVGKAFWPFPVAGTGSSEPAVANGRLSPCSPASAGGPELGDQSVRLQGARARTTRDHTSATAVAHTAEATIARPGLTIRADALAARARAECVDGELELEATSSVGEVTIDGEPAVLSTTRVFGGEPVMYPIPGGTVYFNHTVRGPDRISRRAVWVVSPLGEYVLGEATVGLTGGC